MLNATCPSCHQTIPSRAESITPHSPESKDDQVALIHRETRRLDQLIAQLTEEKMALMRRLNAIQSRTAVLPIEILSSIFEYAWPLPDFSSRYGYIPYIDQTKLDFPQFNLSAVSSHWRQVVWSTPRMWISVHLHITLGGAETAARVLRHFIKNSQQLPFTLALSFSGDVHPGYPYLVHEVVDDLLIETLSRIQEFHLFNPPNQWEDYITHLTQLRDFSIDFDHSGGPEINCLVAFPSNAPLRRLTLSEVLWLSDANTQSPWETLTLLNLSYVPPDSSIQALIQCPNLVYFCCASPLSHQPYLERVTLTRPISLQHLVSFHWETRDRPWSRALIQHLHVPALERMHWNTFGTNSNNNADIRAFFGRLPSTLKTLTLDATASNLEYIRNDSNIKFLKLPLCKTSELRILFQKLRPRQQGGRTVKPFPLLEEVQLEDDLYDDNTMTHVDTLDTSYSSALVEMLEQRLDESGPSFTLDMEATAFQWTPETRTRLSALTSRGYKVTIIERSDDDD